MKLMDFKVYREVAKATYKGVLTLEKAAPELCLVAGIGCIIGGSVMLVKAAMKLEEVSEDIECDIKGIKHDIEHMREHAGDPNYCQIDPIPTEMDLVKEYGKAALRYFNLFAPAVGLQMVGIGLVISGQEIYKSRYLGAVAAYNAASEYAKRLEEKLQEMMDNPEETVKKKKEYEKRQKEEGKDEVPFSETLHEIIPDQYSRFFDSTSDKWNPDPGMSYLYIRSQEMYFNDRLLIRGYVTLNEVYEAMGFDPTPYGQFVGWIRKPDRVNRVDMGVFNSQSEASRRFVNGLENVVLLNFNVDGIIYDKIGQIKKHPWERVL